MNESIKTYTELTNNINTAVSELCINDSKIEDFNNRILKANRIFITGTGTSLPTAQYLASELQKNHNINARFLVTAKMIRQLKDITQSDLVIIISHGFNRADSLIIYNMAVDSCDTIIITGKKEPKIKKSTLLINIPPENEKIFCRPISPITTILAIRLLLKLPIPNEIKNINNLNEIINWIDPKKQIIILFSADVSFGAELWGIVLREGAGLNVSIKDIENYSHGYYGVDTADLTNRQFIILTSNSELDKKDYGRANGLYDIDNFNKKIIILNKDNFTANLELFKSVPEIIKSIIIKTNYDMNHPFGMDNNRKYHEYDRYRNHY